MATRARKKRATAPKKSAPIRNFLKAVRYEPERDEVIAFWAETAQASAHPHGVLGFYVDRAVARARGGDPEAAKEVLWAFIEAMDDPSGIQPGGVFHPAAEFIAEGLKGYLDGKPADISLGLKSPKSGRRPSKDTPAKYERLAAGYELLRQAGMTADAAKDQMMHAGIGAAARTIERAVAECAWVRGQQVETLRIFAGSDSPKIRKIIGNYRKR
jgi:hypothetical protein